MRFLPSMQSGKIRLPSGVVWIAIYSIHPRRKRMSCHPRVTEWTLTIQAHLPHLSKPQATVLALWSLGMVLARSCALTAVSAFLGMWLGRKENTVRQQWREFCYEATAHLDRDRPGRSGPVCSLAVSAHHPVGVAPVFAHQHRRDVSSSGPSAWRGAEDLGAAAGHVLAGHGHRLQRPPPPAPLHAAG